MGPDEYHDRSPGADAPGLNNNAYTNIMAVWTLQCGSKVLDLLAPDRSQELCQTRFTCVKSWCGGARSPARCASGSTTVV